MYMEVKLINILDQVGQKLTQQSTIQMLSVGRDDQKWTTTMQILSCDDVLFQLTNKPMTYIPIATLEKSVLWRTSQPTCVIHKIKVGIYKTGTDVIVSKDCATLLMIF